MFNRTTIFIIPLLLSRNDDLKNNWELIKNIKGYLGINEFEHKNEIFLKINNKYKDIIDILKKKDNFAGITIIKDYSIILLKIPTDNLKDFYRFLVGNYSKMNRESRSKIHRYWFKTDNDDIQNIAFNTLFDIDVMREKILKKLISNSDNDTERKTLKKALDDVHEVNIIPRLEEELIFTK